jgi:hypothetical protein
VGCAIDCVGRVWCLVSWRRAIVLLALVARAAL